MYMYVETHVRKMVFQAFSVFRIRIFPVREGGRDYIPCVASVASVASVVEPKVLLGSLVKRKVLIRKLLNTYINSNTGRSISFMCSWYGAHIRSGFTFNVYRHSY